MSILTSFVGTMVIAVMSDAVHDNAPDWYYCSADDLFRSRIFFTSDGANRYMTGYINNNVEQMTYYSPYHIDENGYIILSRNRCAPSLNNSNTFPYLTFDYTMQYHPGNDSITAVTSSGVILSYEPCRLQSSPTKKDGVGFSEQLVVSDAGPPPLYPHPYYCSDKICIGIGMSFNQWIIRGFINTMELKTTPCWHWLQIWAPFDVNSSAVNITGPYTSFHFTFRRLNASVLEVQPHHSSDRPTVLHAFNNLPIRCPP